MSAKIRWWALLPDGRYYPFPLYFSAAYWPYANDSLSFYSPAIELKHKWAPLDGRLPNPSTFSWLLLNVNRVVWSSILYIYYINWNDIQHICKCSKCSLYYRHCSKVHKIVYICSSSQTEMFDFCFNYKLGSFNINLRPSPAPAISLS